MRREISVSFSDGRPFALEIAAGNAAGGEGLFLIIDGEREEIAAGLGGLGGDDGGEDGGLALGREHGAIGLAGDLAGLEHELAPGPIEFFAMDFEHVCLSFMRRALDRHEQDGERLRGSKKPLGRSAQRPAILPRRGSGSAAAGPIAHAILAFAPICGAMPVSTPAERVMVGAWALAPSHRAPAHARREKRFD